MTVHTPQFNIEDFEKRGDISSFLTSEQTSQVTDVTLRVDSQLDWVAQLLGWSGDNYWGKLPETVDQKRQLLGGSFGVYNSYEILEIVEVRNFSNSVLVKGNSHLSNADTLYLGSYSYSPSQYLKVGDTTEIFFESLSEQFLEDLASGEQLKFISVSSLPNPFVRREVGISGDYSFHCKVGETTLTLYPVHDIEELQPMAYNVLYIGSRCYFDLPLSLLVQNVGEFPPVYDFDRSLWYLDIPSVSSTQGELQYGSVSLDVTLNPWSDPSDWVDKELIDNFKGVWGNKGGVLPLHFSFDALSLHGYSTESVQLQDIHREIEFDKLLNLVYQQTTQVGTTPPPVLQDNQLWWDPQSEKLLIHPKRVFNCDPWVECEYPEGLEQSQPVDYEFANVAAFLSVEGSLEYGKVARILNCNGMNQDSKLFGITGSLSGQGNVVAYKSEEKRGWVAIDFSYADVTSFNADSLFLPPYTRVEIVDAEGLSNSGSNYVIENLRVTVGGAYKAYVSKSLGSGKWFLQLPPHLKYVGDTQLYGTPVDGEMYWDFNNGDIDNRECLIFYYNRWEFNPLSSMWELVGDWVNVNTGEVSADPARELNYSALLLYCNGNLLNEGVDYIENNFVFRYEVSVPGSLSFHYTPREPEGKFNFPVVSVSDSLTSSFSCDISDLVFSGLVYSALPNVLNAEQLLRVKKNESLFCVESTNTFNSLSYPNQLLADENSGPGNEEWDRYFVRLPLDYKRDGSEWQKVNLVCQNFGYWGSSSHAVQEICPPQEEKPYLYEEVVANQNDNSTILNIYEESFLYSSITPDHHYDDEFEKSIVHTDFSNSINTFDPGRIESYDPFHNRRADISSPVGKGYGEWEGKYYRKNPCSELTGHLSADLELGSLEEMSPPLWDASMYKVPKTCILSGELGEIQSNKYVVGYAFFCSDLSAAGEAVFEIG